MATAFVERLCEGRLPCDPDHLTAIASVFMEELLQAGLPRGLSYSIWDMYLQNLEKATLTTGLMKKDGGLYSFQLKSVLMKLPNYLFRSPTTGEIYSICALYLHHLLRATHLKLFYTYELEDIITALVKCLFQSPVGDGLKFRVCSMLIRRLLDNFKKGETRHSLSGSLEAICRGLFGARVENATALKISTLVARQIFDLPKDLGRNSINLETSQILSKNTFW